MPSFTTFLDCGEIGQREVEVVYTHHAGYPDNGIDPPEPEWCEVTRVDMTDFHGKDVVDYISETTYAHLCDEALDDYQGA